MKIRDLENKYLKNVKVNKSEGTYNCYKNWLDYMVKYFEANNIFDTHEITNDVITDFILEQRDNDISNTTINKRVSSVIRMLGFSEEEDLPILKFKKLKEKKPEINSLTDEQVKKLFDYLNNSNLHLQTVLMFYIFLDTGIRCNELLNLQIENIDFEEHTIYLEVTKTDVNRVVFFREVTAKLLKEHIGSRRKGKLFTFNKETIKTKFRRTAEKLGFKEFHPHMMRHTFATHLIDQNANIYFVKDLLGHTNVATTQKYLHPNKKNYKKLYDALYTY